MVSYMANRWSPVLLLLLLLDILKCWFQQLWRGKRRKWTLTDYISICMQRPTTTSTKSDDFPFSAEALSLKKGVGWLEVGAVTIFGVEEPSCHLFFISGKIAVTYRVCFTLGMHSTFKYAWASTVEMDPWTPWENTRSGLGTRQDSSWSCGGFLLCATYRYGK